MDQAVFLRASGDRHLAKAFTLEGVRQYPRVKAVTSYHHEYNDLAEFETLLRAHAYEGDCLLKGQLITNLVNESRRGAVNKDALTRLLVVDFDDVEAVISLSDAKATEVTLISCAENLIRHLPASFHNVSYIAQASASCGMKQGVISLHLYFLLETDTHPRVLKELLTVLNFDGGFFESQLKLSATGTALSYVIDPSVADNSRLIYIAPPIFQGVVDPWSSFDDRIVRVTKTRERLDLSQETAGLSAESVSNQIRAHVKELRKASDLPLRAERTKNITINGETSIVVTNPDKVRMNVAEDEGDYVRYNVNDGDSNAYWVYKNNPAVVYNFKGEPSFLFEKADPEAYAAHIEKYTFEDIVTEEGFKPLIFLDYTTARYYYGLYDPTKDRMDSIHRCNPGDLRHFTAQYNAIMPENVPVWSFEFAPNNPTVIDFDERFLNRYCPPDILRYPATISPNGYDVQMGYAQEVMKELTPTIRTLIRHVCGNGDLEFEHFINWLAFAVQEREKALTAWIFHGVPGTGKGLLYANVLAPLFGEDYAMMKRQQDLEEKFNVWMQNCLLFVVDEFRLDNSRFGNQTSMLNKIKNIITEKQGTVRAMNVDQMASKFYANVIFFSNDHDAVRIQEGDRRFNVAPRQEQPFIQAHPELLRKNALQHLCAQELPIFATFLLKFRVDLTSVILPLENEAKETMREASSDSIDIFVKAVQRGDLDYFVPILDERPKVMGEDYTFAAKNILKAILRDYVPGEESLVFISELRPLYNVLCGKADNEAKFGKLLSRHGLQSERFRRGKMNKRGVKIKWHLTHNDIDDLRSEYLTETDLAVVVDNKPIAKALH